MYRTISLRMSADLTEVAINTRFIGRDMTVFDVIVITHQYFKEYTREISHPDAFVVSPYRA